MEIGLRVGEKVVDFYMGMDSGKVSMRANNIGVGRLSALFKALAKYKATLQSLAGKSMLGWRFTIARKLQTKNYGTWNYFEGKKGNMTIQIAYQGTVPISSMAKALRRREGGVISYSIRGLLRAEKWPELEKKILEEARKNRKKPHQLMVKVLNSVSGETEQYVIPYNGVQEFLNELADRNPLGTFRIEEDFLPMTYRVGPFSVVMRPAK